jgi:hypothetical protein
MNPVLEEPRETALDDESPSSSRSCTNDVVIIVCTVLADEIATLPPGTNKLPVVLTAPSEASII